MSTDASGIPDHLTRPTRRVPGRLAQAGLAVLLAAFALDVVALSVNLMRNGRLRQGLGVSEIGLDFSDALTGASNAAVGLGLLVAATTFLIWFANAYRRAADRQLARHTPHWAVTAWFVPGLNAVRPPEMMVELLQARQRLRGRVDGGTASGAGPDTGVLIGWWALWLGGAIIVVALRFLPPTSLDGWAWWYRFAIGADLLFIASLICAIVLVERAD